MKYVMIDKLRNQHPVANLCALLDVAKSGYQAWSAGKVVPPRKLEDMRLLVAIKAAHQRGRGTPMAPRRSGTNWQTKASLLD